MAEASTIDERDDGLPMVAGRAPGNLGLWLFLALLAAGGLWLFSVLSANRAEMSAPLTTIPAGTGQGRITSPPPLALPAAWMGPGAQPAEPFLPLLRPEPVRLVRAAGPVRAQNFPFPQPQYGPPPSYEGPPAPQTQVVFDEAFPGEVSPAPALTGDGVERVMAGRFARPAFTVPQGTIIPAVLETALDSTRPGAVRALVQRDVRGFDGSRVLIPRGSRLYGEYEADLAQGQNRASIRWARLIRPDGVTVALDSPASDPLGRAGVRGEVDSKFFQRFGGALLQSVLDIGVGVATRKASDGVVLALPGSAQTINVQDQQRVQPTLRVRHGTSVSVFVARDLDFSGVDD